MKLSDLIDSLHLISLDADQNSNVASICYDSRKVEKGSLFCAMQGETADGFDFVGQAINNGAIAVLSEHPKPANFDVGWIQVDDSRKSTALAAANFYEHPSSEMPAIGITGTNGKTTTAYLVHHLLKESLGRAGMIGTIEYNVGDQIVSSPRTTPESVDLQCLLREMRNVDCRAVVMEVSSHGLSQHRATGVSFDAGVFTNLSQDHLDYHKNMNQYFDSKLQLFKRMAQDGFKEGSMVVNADDRWGRKLLQYAPGELKNISFGESFGCDMRASNIQYGLNGSQFKLTHGKRQLLIKIPLIGKFNVYNAMAALGAALAINLNLREAVLNLESSPQIPGRLEAVKEGRINYRVFVDYAHTPDALENALVTLRALNPRRIITVFGCGGDRDTAKRPAMARVADSHSDFVVLTSDNPRTEDPQKILRNSEAGFMSSDYSVVENRREAIESAIETAGAKDIVLIAGKGHETYQEIDGVKYDFDDRLVARQCILAKSEST